MATSKFQKVAISPESCNYGDNDDNVAYLYTAKSGNRYYIWKVTLEYEYVGERVGGRDEWNVGPARFVEPDAALGEDFAPYWDDCGPLTTRTYDSRRDCVSSVEYLEASAVKS